MTQDVNEGRLREIHDRLRGILAGFDSLVVAYSGGVDSTFLAAEASRVLGERSLAVTARSSTYPVSQEREAEELARRLGIRHRFIDSEELEIQGFRQNPPDRCYFCKRELFSKLGDLARREGYQAVADGSNLDDLDDFRPGMKALVELGVRSPLREAGLGKADIRQLSRRAGLPTWDKPAFACLSSRFPYGTAITPEALRQVGEGEEGLRRLGFRQVRLRHHGSLARVEVGKDELPRALDPEMAGRLSALLKGLGYTYVTLDLEGYRTGAMNEVLGGEAGAGTPPGRQG